MFLGDSILYEFGDTFQAHLPSKVLLECDLTGGGGGVAVDTFLILETPVSYGKVRFL